MKKLLIILIAVSLLAGAVCLFLRSRTETTAAPEEETAVLTAAQREELKTCIRSYRDKTPRRFGTFGILKHMALKGQHLRMFVDLNPRFYNLKGISEEPEIVKRDLFLNLCNMDDSFDPLFLRLARNRIGLRIELGKDAVDEILEIYFTAGELLQVAQSKQRSVNPYEVLQSHVDVYNLSLPMQVSDRLILKSVRLTKDHLIYDHEVEEVAGNEINRIRAGKQKMAHDILQTLHTSDSPAILEVMHLCRQAHLGMKYRYTGNNSEQTVTIYFDRSQL